MKLSEQCCTLDQAKSLKELGVSQHGATFYFYEEIVNGKTSFPIKPLMIISDSCRTEENESIVQSLEGKYKNEVYAAFTMAEIFKGLRMKVFSNVDYCGYQFDCGRVTVHFGAASLGESVGKLLLTLIEKSQITVDQFNENLNR